MIPDIDQCIRRLEQSNITLSRWQRDGWNKALKVLRDYKAHHSKLLKKTLENRERNECDEFIEDTLKELERGDYNV